MIKKFYIKLKFFRYEYWWKEHWYNSMHFSDTFLDPYGKYYDPDYLHH